MPLLRRILKYTPAMVLGLLVVAWLAGPYGRLSVTYSQRAGPSLSFESTLGSLGIWHHSSEPMLGGISLLPRNGIQWRSFEKSPKGRHYAGTFHTVHHAVCTGGFVTGVQVPTAVVAAVCMPLALGSLISFRFRLWHYLAYTALVALELAYYLQWQE